MIEDDGQVCKMLKKMLEKEGIETIIELKRDNPDIKIIAISGGDLTKPENYLFIAE